MVVRVIEIVSPTEALVQETIGATVIEVIHGGTSPLETTATESVVDVVRPGGTVVNIGAGPVLPENPYEGQIWIDTS